MPKSQLPPFERLSLSESNALQYPEPFLSMRTRCFTRKLFDHPGVANFRANTARIAPNACISRLLA